MPGVLCFLLCLQSKDNPCYVCKAKVILIILIYRFNEVKGNKTKMKITILCVGKIKETYFTMAIEEYSKRLSRYCKLEIIEVADEKIPEHSSEKQIQLIKEKEGERLEKYKKGNAYLCALAIEGKKMDSLEFSKWIEQLGINGISHLVFVIGGSLGLDKKILESSEEKISFSKMTFPHQLMRIILLEQVYRAYRIINKEPYHK